MHKGTITYRYAGGFDEVDKVITVEDEDQATFYAKFTGTVNGIVYKGSGNVIVASTIEMGTI